MSTIENIDCMVQAIASVTGKPEIIDLLRPLRLRQMEQYHGDLDVTVELTHLMELFAAIGIDVTITLKTIEQLAELDVLLASGQKVLLGLPMGLSTKPHIVHLAEKFVRPEIIQDDKVQMGWKGYRSSQQYIESEQLIWTLMEQEQLQLFLIEVR